MKLSIKRMTIRNRIFLSTVGTSLVVLVMAMGITTVLARRVVTADLTNLASSTVRSLEQSIRTRHSNFDAQVRLIADLPVIRAVLSTQDPATMQYFLQQHRPDLGADIMLAMDDQHRMLAADPDGVLGLDSFRLEASTPKPGFACVRTRTGEMRAYQITTAPVTVDGREVGYIVAAYAIGDSLAYSLKRMMGAEVTLFRSANVYGSTWTGRERARIAEYIADTRGYASGRIDHALRRRDALKGRFIGVWGEVREDSNNSLSCIMEFSEKEAMGLFTTAQRLLALLAIPICLATAGIARRVSNRIANPIEAVIAACRAIEADDWFADVEPDPDPEIGLLGRTFNKALAAMKATAGRDSLTGVYNHRYFYDCLARNAAEGDEHDGRFSMLMIDIDRFKEVNDHFGHPTGDRVISGVAEVIRRTVPRDSAVCRYGGDEFAVILPRRGVLEAAKVGETARSALELAEFYANTEELIKVTLSIGVAEYWKPITDVSDLVLAADAAMYYAKRAGRNRVCKFDEVRTLVGIDTPKDIYKIIRESDSISIETLATLMDARPRHTDGHSDRVCRYALALGRALGLAEQQLSDIEVASLLHDVGKIRVSDRILDKPGKLTIEERAFVEKHPAIGAKLISDGVNLGSVLPAILHHHERYDGAGYPRGLAGDDIPLSARIIAIADVYDAMTSERVYRAAMLPREAIREISRTAGKHFDSQLVDIFVSLVLKDPQLPGTSSTDFDHPDSRDDTQNLAA